MCHIFCFSVTRCGFFFLSDFYNAINEKKTEQSSYIWICDKIIFIFMSIFTHSWCKNMASPGQQHIQGGKMERDFIFSFFHNFIELLSTGHHPISYSKLTLLQFTYYCSKQFLPLYNSVGYINTLT